ncbi:hypothetical protein NDU88_004275 [Pleurodeles waltl]|uniref:Uncharacterized protein n=1 Tax=Pleurodeles waltl TaxID=8319 RepID=A0AAV7T7E1_PLEWA|nr:hypothetical protein NDU88_004275 [Pleurodeles waltl]
MTYHTDEDDPQQDLKEIPYEHQMEERLNGALGYHMQNSVNWALIKVLKLFTQPPVRYGKRKLLGSSSHDILPSQLSFHDSESHPRASSGGSSLAEILAQMAASVLRDHEYGSSAPQGASGILSAPQSQDTSYDTSVSSSDSEKSQNDSQPAQRKKRQTHHSTDEVPGPSWWNLLFEPENIIHPRSTEWVPCMEVTHYFQERLRKGFQCEVLNTVRSECPQPSLLGKVTDTPEMDPNMETYLKKFAKDPKKGLDHTWRGCQDKLLDLHGQGTGGFFAGILVLASVL